MRPAVAWRLLLGVASLRVALHLVANAALSYGYTTDELYFLDSVDRLSWGYVDHPPLTVFALAGVTALVGDSLFAIRLVPTLLGGIAVLLTGLLARELSGGRVAQGLAALASAFCPLFLAVTNAYQINALDLVFWSLAMYLLLRILNGADPRTWIALGAVLGLGLLNKYTLLWFGAGLLAGLVLTPQRRWLGTPWPWAAAAVAFVLFAPHVSWQVQNDWPTLEFLRNKAAHYTVATTPLSFAIDQVTTVSPALAPLWIGGLFYLLLATETKPHRAVAWIWIAAVGLLMASGSARSYYAAGTYPLLIAAGARGAERLTRERGWRWLPIAAAVWMLFLGAWGAPFAMPLLSPERFVAYRASLPFAIPKQRVDDVGPLPNHFADRLHGQAVMKAISEAFAALPPEERGRVGIFATDFGTAAAVNRWGAAAGMPRATGSHNSYWLWGPGSTAGDVMIVVWPRDRDLSWWFAEVERVAEFECPYCMLSLTRQSVYVGRNPHRPLAEIWSDLKDYH